VDLHVTLGRRGRLTADVYDQIKRAILDGRLRPGEALPPTRELARRLAVSRNTVLNAYQRLTAEGFLSGRAGAGTFVDGAAAPGGRMTGTSAPPGRAPRAPDRGALEPRAIFRDLARDDAHREPADRARAAYDFSIGSPDPELFPWDEWRSALLRQLRRRRRPGGYPPPEGEPRLRAAIARHTGISRSVRADADDVVVTSGAQQAFDLLGRVLVPPGACVAVEDPGYPPARFAFEAIGARVVPVRVDGEGIDVGALPDDARLVYVTPSHQFPLGAPMSLGRRMALLAWAERRRAAIIEDDYDSEFRFDGRPLEPLQSLDRSGRVLYVGTFSKTLLPTLRIGFVVAPPSVAPALRAAKLVADSHGAVDAQLALADLIDGGGFARHLRRLLRVYRARREALAEAITRRLGDRVAVLPASAGLHTTVVFADRRVAAAAAARAALSAGVRVDPLQPFYAGRARAGLALGYGMIAAPKIDEGIRLLARCLP